MSDFNTNSTDAVLSKILTTLESQNKRFEEKALEDREHFNAIVAQAKITNGRVTKLEDESLISKTRLKLLAVLGAGAVGLVGVGSNLTAILAYIRG